MMFPSRDWRHKPFFLTDFVRVAEVRYPVSGMALE